MEKSIQTTPFFDSSSGIFADFPQIQLTDALVAPNMQLRGDAQGIILAL